MVTHYLKCLLMTKTQDNAIEDYDLQNESK